LYNEQGLFTIINPITCTRFHNEQGLFTIINPIAFNVAFGSMISEFFGRGIVNQRIFSDIGWYKLNTCICILCLLHFLS